MNLSPNNIVHVCCGCEKERVDGGYIPKYRSYDGLAVSHGYCDDCLKKFYPEFFNKIKEQVREKHNV